LEAKALDREPCVSSTIARSLDVIGDWWFVDRGILEARAAADGSAFREYFLIEKGRALFPVLVTLRQKTPASRFQDGGPRGRRPRAAARRRSCSRFRSRRPDAAERRAAMSASCAESQPV
jgi:hypothetical protein